METTRKGGSFFSAMNTAEGFCNYFPRIFGKFERLYIIKGGSGTGKSRFMKDLSFSAKKKGYTVEDFYCSSDFSSLDGVIIKEINTAVIDGTAPHSYEPIVPGAKDNIIDLGQFWKSDILAQRRDEIESINSRKAKLYSEIYTYMRVIRGYDDITAEIVEEAIYLEKIRAAAARLVSGFASCGKYKEEIRIRSSVTLEGILTLNTYSELAKTQYAVADFCRSAGVFMRCLQELAKEKKLSITVSYSPFDPKYPDAIYFTDSDVSVYIGCSEENEEKRVNMRRFLDDKVIKSHKLELKSLSKLRAGTLEQVFSDYRKIKSLHEKVENIYFTAMDFDSKEKYCNEAVEKLLECKFLH